MMWTGKQLTRKQILEKMREINEGEDSKMGFCQNSRRWMLTFGMFGFPESCPYQKEQGTYCERCGYYKMREPTKYLISMMQALGWGTGEAEK